MSEYKIPPPSYLLTQEGLYGSFASIDDLAQAVIQGKLNPDEWTVEQLTKMHIKLDVWNNAQNDRRKAETEAISRFTQEIFRRQLQNMTTAPNRHAISSYHADMSMNMQTRSTWSTNSFVETSVPDDSFSTCAQTSDSAYDADLSQVMTEEEDVKIIEDGNAVFVVEETPRWSDDQSQNWSPLAQSSPKDYEDMKDYFYKD